MLAMLACDQVKRLTPSLLKGCGAPGLRNSKTVYVNVHWKVRPYNHVSPIQTLYTIARIPHEMWVNGSNQTTATYEN